MSADFDKIRALDAKATSAPWCYEIDPPDSPAAYAIGTYIDPTGARVSGCVDFCDDSRNVVCVARRMGEGSDDDLPLIVALRNAVPEILALTAERDALAALLGEARVLVRAWDEPESHDPDAALEALRAALARIDAASGGRG